MNRRAFNGLVGGLAVAWPFAARGQQPALPVVGLYGGPSVKQLFLGLLPKFFCSAWRTPILSSRP
jgi:hypothetical protein